MKISICIPQYNRINILLKNLRIIEQQGYATIEVVVSDDCSSDNTEAAINQLIPVYKYPLLYHRFTTNQGYDKNLRKSIELATGEYVIIVGNDDTINPDYDLQELVSFLQQNNYPELGFANFREEDSTQVVERAKQTTVLGSGYETALRYYSCFSFVGGIIFKRTAFLAHNTDKHDGSIYAQIYLACYITALGNRLFSIRETVVIKDLAVDQVRANSYREKIAKKWKDYRKVDGGLPSVIHVIIAAMIDARVFNQQIAYRIFRKIYLTTFPFWIIDYKSNGALPEAVGLISGLNPASVKDFSRLNYFNRIRIYGLYVSTGSAALLFPVFIFKRIKSALYNFIKK
jgi:glycosyltransferase involved in cell wall biosynthesis